MKTAMAAVGGAFDGQECGTMSGRDGGTTRVNAATVRRQEGGATKGRQVAMRQPADAARRRDGGVTRGREGRVTIGDSKTRGGRDETMRGMWDGRQCNNQPVPNQKEDDEER